jgi:DNA-binding MarR family transcriptional regulator
MSIEKEIRQRDFRNEYQKATINILYSANWLEDRIKNFLEPEDITLQQYNILRILRNAGKPLSTLQIRERMIDRMSDTSRIVERLLKKELVEKKVSAADKRLVDVTISKKGDELLDKIDLHIDALDNIIDKLTQDEAKTLNKLLDKMRSTVH